jgi:nicotinate-nucleotide adenylyltransferase
MNQNEQFSRIGMVGGSFNPIHNAHLIMATCYAEQFKLDKCIFIPARVSPAKLDSQDLANTSHRWEMVKLAVSGNPLFDCDDFEINNDSISFTYLTIEHFQKLYSESELYILIGTDQAEQFDSWRNFNWLLRNVKVVIAGRQQSEASKDRIKRIWERASAEPYFLESPEIEISAEMLRNRLRNNLSIRYFVPDSVADYVDKNKLYR